MTVDSKPVISVTWLWPITIITVSLVAVWFLWPQISVIALTILMAFVFYPLYARLKGKKEKSSLAAALTLIASFLVVIIPVSFVITASVGQLFSLADSLGHENSWPGLNSVVEEVAGTSNLVMEKLAGIQTNLTGESLVAFLKTPLLAIAQTTVQVALGVIGGIPQLVIATVIYIFLFIELLMGGSSLIKRLKQLSPFDSRSTGKYLERIGLMANAMVKGQLIIAMVLAVIASALLWLIGYGQYFLLFFVLFTVLNFIPLGSGIVVTPLALLSIATGQFWMGLIVIVLFYASGNLDPIMRAKLIPREIQQSVALTMIATFCGIAYFGMLGVVYGPIIMIFITTTLEFYLKYKKQSIPLADR